MLGNAGGKTRHMLLHGSKQKQSHSLIGCPFFSSNNQGAASRQMHVTSVVDVDLLQLPQLGQ
jgi:hypothetical protein